MGNKVKVDCAGTQSRFTKKKNVFHFSQCTERLILVPFEGYIKEHVRMGNVWINALTNLN